MNNTPEVDAYRAPNDSRNEPRARTMWRGRYSARNPISTGPTFPWASIAACTAGENPPASHVNRELASRQAAKARNVEERNTRTLSRGRIVSIPRDGVGCRARTQRGVSGTGCEGSRPGSQSARQDQGFP